MSLPRRVIIIGAGLSGLRTADLLLSSGVSQVVVLEATDRVGGRLFRQDYQLPKGEGEGEVVKLDLGGQWIGPPQKFVSELVDELGLVTEEQFDQGGAILEMQGEQIQFEGNIGTLQRFGTEELLEKSWETLDKLALSVPISDPYLSPQASEWDNMSLEEWMKNNVVSANEPQAADQVRKLINWFAVVCLCVESSQVSFLYFLWWLHAGGGYQPLVNVKDGAQHYWLPNSAQEIAQKLRERVEKKGGLVILNSPVVHIQQQQQQQQSPVVVTYRREGRYVVMEGEEVVVSVPPSVMSSITFSPPLPSTRAVMHQRMPMGCVIKYIVVYRKPWWREMGLSGTLLSDEGPIGVVYDKSLPAENFYALVCFMTGNTAREWGKKTPEERRNAIADQFVKVYKTEKARSDLVEVLEKDWTEEPYARGCYMCIPSPGGLQGGMEHFREPFGKIHFVGTETGNVWIGYMDGALESAHRATKEILETPPSAKL